MEGRNTALELAKEGIKVNFFVDCAIAQKVKEADFVMIGADSLYPNGNVVNKIGSYPLAVTARMHDKPFYVMTHSLKLKLKELHHQDNIEEFHDPKEVWDIEHENIEVLNPYFELVPGYMITRYFTEKGGLSRDNLSTIFRERLEYMFALNIKRE